MTFEVAADDAGRAEAALREAGFAIESVRDGNVAVSKSTGTGNPDSDAQAVVHKAATEALENQRISFRLTGSGLVIVGGEPGFRWIEVTLDGDPMGLKIGATNDEEADAQLKSISEELGVERERLNISPPAGWAGYGVVE
jgi:hypothetical protein